MYSRESPVKKSAPISGLFGRVELNAEDKRADIGTPLASTDTTGSYPVSAETTPHREAAIRQSLRKDLPAEQVVKEDVPRHEVVRDENIEEPTMGEKVQGFIGRMTGQDKEKSPMREHERVSGTTGMAGPSIGEEGRAFNAEVDQLGGLAATGATTGAATGPTASTGTTLPEQQWHAQEEPKYKEPGFKEKATEKLEEAKIGLMKLGEEVKALFTGSEGKEEGIHKEAAGGAYVGPPQQGWEPGEGTWASKEATDAKASTMYPAAQGVSHSEVQKETNDPLQEARAGFPTLGSENIQAQHPADEEISKSWEHPADEEVSKTWEASQPAPAAAAPFYAAGVGPDAGSQMVSGVAPGQSEFTRTSGSTVPPVPIEGQAPQESDISQFPERYAAYEPIEPAGAAAAYEPIGPAAPYEPSYGPTGRSDVDPLALSAIKHKEVLAQEPQPTEMTKRSIEQENQEDTSIGDTYRLEKAEADVEYPGLTKAPAGGVLPKHETTQVAGGAPSYSPVKQEMKPAWVSSTDYACDHCGTALPATSIQEILQKNSPTALAANVAPKESAPGIFQAPHQEDISAPSAYTSYPSADPASCSRSGINCDINCPACDHNLSEATIASVLKAHQPELVQNVKMMKGDAAASTVEKKLDSMYASAKAGVMERL